MSKVLVTGGAGYIGSVLTRLLLASGYRVRVLDSLMFGGDALIDQLNDPGFDFVRGDLRDDDAVRSSLEGIDHVVHLAAIVGDPACAKDPDLTRAINGDASRRLFQLADEAGVDRFVFASTCSNYGKMADPSAYVDEESELAPVSLYAETKVDYERYLLEADTSCTPVVLRFSTVFGLSPRPRFDLTVNEFTKELALDRELVVFGEQFWRPYCHVVDLARSVLLAIESDATLVRGEVFNVGATAENYQKQMIVEEILKVIPEGRVRYVEKDEDPRDYRVSFDKIREQLGFEVTITVPDGIRQVHTAVLDGLISDPDDARYRNV